MAGQGLLSPPLLHTASRDRLLTPQPPSVVASSGFRRGTECEGSHGRIRGVDRKLHVPLLQTTGSRTSRFYKRHDGQTQACGWDPKARGWKVRLGVFAGETC
uniref:Uncharacterized protein n=1 Tax=Rangifer tarandus platyrhynchus TaxID=3082113 RepID=A0ACB0F664_RANTA|nr:unnamed protein product [Rangifer tarandus platyrhynchus]